MARSDERPKICLQNMIEAQSPTYIGKECSMKLWWPEQGQSIAPALPDAYQCPHRLQGRPTDLTELRDIPTVKATQALQPTREDALKRETVWMKRKATARFVSEVPILVIRTRLGREEAPFAAACRSKPCASLARTMALEQNRS